MPSSAEGLLFYPRVAIPVELCRWPGLLWLVDIPWSTVYHDLCRKFEPFVSDGSQVPWDGCFHLACHLYGLCSGDTWPAGPNQPYYWFLESFSIFAPPDFSLDNLLKTTMNGMQLLHHWFLCHWGLISGLPILCFVLWFPPTCSAWIAILV